MNLQATINKEYDEWQYWSNIYHKESWEKIDKTREDVLVLMNYFEGRYDMACDLRHMINNKES